MKRRRFLTFAGIGSAILLIPSIALLSTSVSKATVEIIIKELDYLKLDKTGVEKYVEDYYKLVHLNYFSQMKWKFFYFLKIDAENSNSIKDVVSYYLLSTDFFYNNMDESRVVNYLGFYNPYKTPCGRPFSYVFYPPEKVS